MNRIGQRTIVLPSCPKIIETASVVGEKEGQGNLANYFDKIETDCRCGEDSWEKAESKLQKTAMEILLTKSKKKPADIDLIFGGDLINQCTSTSFGIMDLGIPFFGLFGACSTMAESLCLASMAVDGQYADTAVAITSSHFCDAEKQFRFPLEYGGQRTPTSQWTVTGSGACLLSNGTSGVGITHITPGKIIDMGINDANNMGAAMAPAAIDTINQHFKDRGIETNYFDLVVTGDLGIVGHAIALEQLKNDGLDFKDRYIDCGIEIFDIERQDMHAGASGCGCCASVFSGWLYKRLVAGEIKKILLVATGALLSPLTTMQGENIPAIAHAVAIEKF